MGSLSPRRLRRALALGTALVLASAATAAAGPKAADAIRHTRAKSFVDAGLILEDAKDYDGAIESYIKANDLEPNPRMLYNIAEAHYKAAHHAEALAHYRRYLALEPDGLKAKDAAAKVEKLTVIVAAEETQRAAEEAQRAEEARRASAERARRAEEERLAEQAREADKIRRALDAADDDDELRAIRERRAAIELAQRQSAVRRKSERYRRSGLAIGGLGVIALGAGVYFALDAHDKADQISKAYDPGVEADGQRAERWQLATMTTGGVLVATGAVLTYLGWRVGREAAGLDVAPVGGTGASLTVTGAW